MGISERKSKEKRDLRNAILHAAEELFVSHGFENVSMRKIAQSIEYSPTTIYLYFKNKNDLLNCLLEDYYSKLSKALSKVQDESENPLLSIKKGMRVYIEFGIAHPNYYKLAFLTSPDFSPEDYTSQNSIGKKIFGSLRANVEKCIEKRIFPKMDADLATQILWSISHGVASLLITNPGFPWADTDDLINQTIKTALKGLSV